ncbi:MAG: NAD(P)/FAD-dependent oxidoreductase, partial [Omnitrophica WOR_2 bacterium]
MVHYNYLIVGGGMTADAAARGIRKIDPDGTIGMFSLESDLPYNRPLLSKGLWKGKTIDKAMRGTEKLNVVIQLRSRVTALNPLQKQVTDQEGKLYSYDKLLLATGGTPRRLPFGGGDVLYYRTLEDYRRLRQMSDQKDRFAVIGSGFIGSEIAAALAMNGKQVTMIYPEDGISGHVFPGDLSLFLNDYYRQKGVDICPNSTVSGLQRRDGGFLVKLSNGKQVPVDGVIAGLGILPSYELAQSAGLEVKSGILVDEYLRTSQPDIYAAGDVAEFYNPALGKHIRVEHEDNANTMGQTAGINMAASLRNGTAQLYHYLP